jgi:S-adenosylmethionine hydrolase
VDTYAEAAAGSACALVGSSDHLEIAVVDGSAAARLGVGRGASVTVTRR